MTSTEIAERKRVEAVVETLAAIHHHGESLGEVAHDARNMVTALSLYCDLLEEPGILPATHRHYGSELRLVAEASRRLVEKLALLASGDVSRAVQLPPIVNATGHLFESSFDQRRDQGEPLSDELISDLREEILAARNLLDAIAGPSIAVAVEVCGGAWPIRMSTENLVRVLVNVVRNAAESIAGAGTINLRLEEKRRGAGRSLVLIVEDSGPGIPDALLEKVFESGFSTRDNAVSAPGWNHGHRGLGLAITRSIVEAAGGAIHAENGSGQGARFVIALPVRAS